MLVPNGKLAKTCRETICDYFLKFSGAKFANNTGLFETSHRPEGPYNTGFSQYCCEKSDVTKGLPVSLPQSSR